VLECTGFQQGSPRICIEDEDEDKIDDDDDSRKKAKVLKREFTKSRLVIEIQSETCMN
jgi:hypothetical protein